MPIFSFGEAVQRRLRPWLLDDPDTTVDVELGILNSRLSIRNLKLDASVLNLFVESLLSFKEVTVDVFTVRFSQWAFPAFEFEVRGLNATLSPQGNTGRKSAEAINEERKKKVLSSIDPEGCALHEVLGRILESFPSTSWLSTSVLNLLLRHCRVWMFDSKVQVQGLGLDATLVCFLELKEVNAGPKYRGNGCLLRGLAGALFKPLKETSMIMDFKDLRIGYKMKDHSKLTFSSVELSTSIKLKDLKIAELSVGVPEVTLFFSPLDLPVLSSFGELSSKDSENVRNGRQLWRIVSSKLGYMISSPRLSFHNLVEFVCLWLRYLNAYEHLLSSLRYSLDNSLKTSANKVFQDKKAPASASHSWEVISGLEKLLPAEAIAQARRVARYRAALHAPHDEDGCTELSGNSQFKVFSWILWVLLFIWNAVYTIVFSIIHFVLLIKEFFQEFDPDEDTRIASNNHYPQYLFLLNLGKILMTFSPINIIQNTNSNLESTFGFSYPDIHAFHLSINALLLVYVDKMFEQSLCISSGKLNVKTSPVTGATVSENSSKNESSSIKGQGKGTVSDAETVMWSEPATVFSPSTGEVGGSEYPRKSILQDLLEEACLNWERAYRMYCCTDTEGCDIPWVLCQINSSLTCLGVNNPDIDFWNCSFIIGKLNLRLGYSSIMSIAVLLGQMQHALKIMGNRKRVSVLSHSPLESENQQNSEVKYELYARRMMKNFLGMLPAKNICLILLIIGPHIQISAGNIGSDNNHEITDHVVDEDGFQIGFGFSDIEALVCPTSKLDLVSSELPEADGIAECHQCLQEPEMVKIPKSDTDKYACQDSVSISSYLSVSGLAVHRGDFAERTKSRILSLSPAALWSKYIRESAYSFGSTTVAFSAALSVLTNGFTIALDVDELLVLSKMARALLSAVSYACLRFDMTGILPSQDSVRESLVFQESETRERATEEASLIDNTTLFNISGTLIFKSMDLIFYDSRMKSEVGSSTRTNEALKGQKLASQDKLDYGIGIYVQKNCIELSSKEDKLEATFDLTGMKSVIFGYQDRMRLRIHPSIVENLLQDSNCCSYDMSLANCTFSLLLGQPHCGDNSTLDNHAMKGDTSSAENSHRIGESEPSRAEPVRLAPALDLASDIIGPLSSNWMLINVSMDGIFMGSFSAKNILMHAHQTNKFTLSLSLGRNLESVHWKMQGGLLFLQGSALTIFARSFLEYFYFCTHLLSISISSVKQVESAQDEFQETLPTTEQRRRELPESVSVDVSKFSLVLADEDGSGGLLELVSEIDVHVKVEPVSMSRKCTIDLSRMSIFSQVLQEFAESGDQIPHFSHVSSRKPSCSLRPRDSGIAHQHIDGIRVDHQNHILDNLFALISFEKPGSCPLHLNQVWVGNGSVSGFHIMISLSEIQMISNVFSAFPASYDKAASSNCKQQLQYNDRDVNRSFKDLVPDGAIVAIQDVHQHQYFTVEGGEDTYRLVGVIHYSLTGKKALFRVKHQKQGIWKSSVQWFSLISLHAKNGSGEPLRLNYRPGSGFVEITATGDGGWSLWRTVPCENESYRGDIDWELYSNLFKDAFYLVNKKNHNGVAFIDETAEFVKKPGNPFKFRVFNDTALTRDVSPIVGLPSKAFGPDMCRCTHIGESPVFEHSGTLPCIQIAMEIVSLTIVHELSDTKERVPLLRCCIQNIKTNLQVLAYKTRLLSTLCVLVYYFDGQNYTWRELVNPFTVAIFHRSSHQIKGSETAQDIKPVHIHCRIKEVDMSITELSLDILLFVIGKLNLAGPFSVRNPVFLANCCKVDNQLGLQLICHFSNNRSVTVARKQSASILLRNPDSLDQSAENLSDVTIQISDLGSFATSSLNLSLSETRAIAWRTRIASDNDSKTYPGPFVIVDISRKPEEGLYFVVSPLIRIHNETKFSMELRFQRPQHNDDVFASLFLKKGDSIDDAMACFDAINLSGGLRKALMSLSVGNFLFSFRPESMDEAVKSNGSISVEWSDELKGGKAVRLSGIFDKLRYEIRKALSIGSMKYSFSTAHCAIRSEGDRVTDLHFLIHTVGRDVPILQPDKSTDSSENRTSVVALQEQKEIFLLPTVRVFNLLQSETHVLLTETEQSVTVVSDNICKQATIPCGSTADFYANPTLIYFTVTLTAFNSSCKPVNSAEWVKKLLKQKSNACSLEIDLDFDNGKYFASLRLSRGHRGILEAFIFTPYSLKNDTDMPLFFFSSNQKFLSRDEVAKFGSSIPPELGLLLPPNSTGSWFLKSHKLRFNPLEEQASDAMLDLNALSGLTEISLEKQVSGVFYATKFGVSIGPSLRNLALPAETVTVAPRHVVFNESDENITIRQCYLEDETTGMIRIGRNQKSTLQLRNQINQSRQFSVFENVIRKHRNDVDTASACIQFQLNEPESGWSGPVCISSLGHFFLKFRKPPNQMQISHNIRTEFAGVHVVEDGSTLGLHFHRPPYAELPYQIENHLHDVSLTYYQKDSSESEVLRPDCSAHYVWDDLTLPHKLVVVINDMHLLREINLDKVRPWKPFLKVSQSRGLAPGSLLENKSRDRKTYFGLPHSLEIVKVGYEIYANGHTRVLRVCENPNSNKGDGLLHLRSKIQLRLSNLAFHFLEHAKQGVDESEQSACMPLIVARLGNIDLNTILNDQQTYYQIIVKSINVDEKWIGAPFAAMLRGHQLDFSDSSASVLNMVFVLLPTRSNVKQVKHLAIVLQPVDLNLDEETLMRVASFWRKSLSDSSIPSQQYYFDHFEVHPIKVIANFLPGDSYSSYNSAQETLRSLLHSVVKVPPIKNMVVELNGVLVTHALITMRELLIRCAQHYSWYAMRAIYIAKGSPLLPPAFASIFDDLSSSSLDVFFDPSGGLTNIPGLTLGTFKLISKCIDDKGFSGTKRYFGDLGKTLRTVGSNVLFAAITEISDSVLKGAETRGFDGMVKGFRQGILNLAMEPSVLGTAVMGGGPDKKIKLDQSPGADELYIEGYLQAMLDTVYRQEYLRVRVIDDQVILKNLPPNSTLIEEIVDRVKGFLMSKALLKGDPSTSSRPLRHLRGESEWKIGPTVMTLCEHLFVSFAIRMLRKQTAKLVTNIKVTKRKEDTKVLVPVNATGNEQKARFAWKWGIGQFVLSGILAYIDGRLCRGIPNPVARRIVSGYLLSFLEKDDSQ